MSRLPDSRPSGIREASWGDAWLLVKMGGAMLVLALWKFQLWRWVMIGALALLVLEAAILALLGAAEVVLLVLAVIVALPVLSIAMVAVHVAWRLLDPNRLVMIAPDGRSSLDVLFRSRCRISLANHGRAFGATSARALRASVAHWLIGLADYQVDIRAQNKRVAEHYIQQFPQLVITGHDWMGHPKLGLTDVRTAT
ncbi:hypothetical protein LJR044_003160 [Microbacterium foliorum]